jgi:Fur family transcriptional regulator, ferric uptake regulator
MTNFADALHVAKLRVTPARVAILSVLENEKRPLSVEKIIATIGEKNIDYVTAYRTITALKNVGLVRQIDFQHNHAHFELASLGDHHHVVCVKCDKVADVKSCDVDAMQQRALKESGFQTISQHSLEFFGICKQCLI